MAIQRKAVRKRIQLPGGDYVDIPVLERVPFVVAQEQYQERNLYFRNGADGRRKVRVQAVQSLDGSETIDVERIERFPVRTASEQYQERAFILKNNDPPPIQVSGSNNPAHEKVHYVRYYKDNNQSSNSWVDVELIDRLKIIDPSSQYQEWRLYIRHDQPGQIIDDSRVPYVVTLGNCDPSLPLSATEAGIDPPYRLDPLQNIVTFRTNENTEPFLQRYGGFTPGESPFSAAWDDASLLGFSVPGIIAALANGTAFIAGTIDMRLVDQAFTPHTYPDDASPPVIHGYAFSGEWDTLFNIGQIWHTQLTDYQAAHPGETHPRLLDYYYPAIKSYSDAWWQRFIDSGNVSGNPRPFIWVRWVIIDGGGVRH